ncbi:N-acetylglucosamine-6-phosphate deacetylase [Deinococcus misasensis]|uniref:N-acetylglucosamine-6-phosphate deacetylase n=1 Tax=Deinococcus misasensis TaxID=392413 RepID=UPI000558522F|nr:N-acetylglucosamine-6-phosphate deacetylase [Deinococcus misasensis]
MTGLSGWVLTSSGFQTGTLTFEGRVQHFEPQDLSGNLPHVVPGFLDVHVHGGGGFDVMDGPEGILGMARFHAQHGTTSLLATTMTRPWEQVLQALSDIQQVMGTSAKGAAQVLGAHLEGPFISPHRLGAQPDFTLEPTPERVQEVLQVGCIRLVTLAPELPNALEAIKTFADHGVRVSMGHTAGNENHVLEAVAHGARGCTHTFNATGGLTGREPGVLGAVLTCPEVQAEVILDFHHVHPLSFKLLHTLKPEATLLITDAMRAAGLPDGVYDLGGQAVQVKEGVTRTLSGSLAGSVLTMDQAVRNAVECGVALEEAVRMASRYPARHLGLQHKGEIKVGHDADLVVLDTGLQVQQVYIKGQAVLPA